MSATRTFHAWSFPALPEFAPSPDAFSQLLDVRIVQPLVPLHRTVSSACLKLL
jgi:hypothetical protein